MERYQCIQRLRVNRYQPIERILEYAQRYPGAFDSVAIIVPPFKDKEYPDLIQALRRYAGLLHNHGIGMQLNVSFIIGHGDARGVLPENGNSRDFPRDVLGPYEIPFPTMVDWTGQGCKLSACPRGEAFKREAETVCAAYAGTGADAIWLDDDLRMQNHTPVSFGCFCDSCIARFNQENVSDFTRDQLVRELEKDHWPTDNTLRKKWLHYNHRTLVELTKGIADAIFAVNQNIAIGYMAVGVELTVYDLPDYKALTAPLVNARHEVYFRPGGLFWNDKTPVELIYKAFRIARQNAWSIPDITRKYSEHCVNPYFGRAKAMRICALEFVSHIAMGGACGIMPEAIDGNIPEQGEYLELLCRMRPYLSALSQALEGFTQIGFLPYCHPETWAYHDSVSSLNQMRDGGSDWPYRLLEAGIPLTAWKAGALGVILPGQTVKAMPETELKDWMKKAVFADGTAAGWIEKRLGNTELGVTISECTPSLNTEFFTDESLNKPYARYRRRPAMGDDFRGSADMKLTGARALSVRSLRAGTYEDTRLAGVVGMAVNTTKSGGRACVSAQKPWAQDILSNAKICQITNVFEWLAGGRLPVRIKSTERVAQSIWQNGEERILTLFSLDFDDAPETELIFDGNYKIKELSQSGEWRAAGEGSQLVFSLPAWGWETYKLIRA